MTLKFVPGLLWCIILVTVFYLFRECECSASPLVAYTEPTYQKFELPKTSLNARGRPLLVIKNGRNNKHKYLSLPSESVYWNRRHYLPDRKTSQSSSWDQHSTRKLMEGTSTLRDDRGVRTGRPALKTKDGVPVLDISTGIKNISCPRPNGRFPILRQCSKYLECSFNIGYIRKCALGTFYDYRSTGCDFPYRVECADDFNLHHDDRETSESISTLPPPLTPSILNKPIAVTNSEGVVSLECPVKSGQLAIPDRCSEFLNCWAWKGSIMHCPAGTLFNCQKEKCDFPSKVRCVQSENVVAPMQDMNDQKTSSDSQPEAGTGGLPETGSTEHGLMMQARARFTHVVAPPSGQRIRLREGDKPSQGNVQLYHEGHWNYVCERDITDRIKNLICQDLGFTRGFSEVQFEQSPPFRVNNNIRPLALVCVGNETHIHECRKRARNSCKIMAIRCVENSRSVCSPGYILSGDSCFSIQSERRSHGEAKQQCQASGGTLLQVDSQERSDFVSELLQYFPDLRLLHTAGVGVSLFGSGLWLWESNTEPITFQKWWPGWDRRSEGVAPRIGNSTVCLVLQSTYPSPPPSARSLFRHETTMVDSGYFWWTAADCSVELPFICQAPMLDIGCFRGNGGDYTGEAKVSHLGRECLSWSDTRLSAVASRLALDTLLIEDHQYCRNPDNDYKPWCFVSAHNFDYCDIPRCNSLQDMRNNDTAVLTPAPDLMTPDLVIPSSTPPVTSTVSNFSSSECSEGKFRCGDGFCVFFSWVCDGASDCANHKDESGCHVHINDYYRRPGSKLVGFDVEMWLYTTKDSCAKYCSETKDFICRAFNYRADKEQCFLLDSNVALSGSMEEDLLFDLYELKSEVPDCQDSFVCSSGKCIGKNQLCDGRRDCAGNEDEVECRDMVGFQLRLVNGAVSQEGRLEAKAFGRWGVICDDEFTMVDAAVACRHLGFHLGAVEVVTNSGFGSGNEVFVMDDLACQGDEERITDCDFAGWFRTDCTPAEVVGVRCRVLGDNCTDTQWQCDNSHCVDVNYVCDRVDDCGDFSDESDELCKKPVEVRLAGGSNTSGRVEIRYKGIWGTVCDDDFEVEDAQVLCRELGLPGTAVVHQGSVFGPGAGHIWLDQVDCAGFENSLVECSHLEWGQSNCGHDEDVGVSCQDSSTQYLGDYTSAESMQVVSQEILPASCGRRYSPDKPVIPPDQNAKLVRGMITEPGAHPWMVGVRIKSGASTYHWCGAVLISRLHVLSAAHCLLDYPQQLYVLRVGDYDNQVEDEEEQEFTVEKLIPHPDFNSGSYLNNDIVVIRIKSSDGSGVQFGNHVQPVCLTPADVPYQPGRKCTICGWGSTGGNSGYARRMQSAVLPLLPLTTCKAQQVYGPEKITRGMYCAGYLEGGIDTCQGDSGGPMVCQHQGTNVLYGITSWGQGCARPNKPGVYTKITHYLPWIYSVLQKEASEANSIEL